MKDKPTKSKRLQIRMDPSGYMFLEDLAREIGTDVSNLAREIIYKEITTIMTMAVKKTKGVKKGVTRSEAKKIGVKKYK
jgi:predicted DNA-binding protein